MRRQPLSKTKRKKKTKVVDNNDDLESEDDNDSEPPEASPEEAVDADTDADPRAPFSRHTPEVFQAAAAASAATVDVDSLRAGTAGRERAVESMPPVLSGRSAGGGVDVTDTESRGNRYRAGGGGSGDKTGAGGVAWRRDAPVGGIADGARAAAAVAEGDNSSSSNPWPGIDWGETAETGSGGVVRRWGRAVEEAESDGVGEAGEFDLSPGTAERSGEHSRGKERRDRDGDEGDSRGGGMQARGEGGGRWTGRGKKERGMLGRDRGKGASTASEAAKAAAAAAASRAAAAMEVAVATGGRKERRRTSGSRAPKALALSNGKGLLHEKCEKSKNKNEF